MSSTDPAAVTDASDAPRRSLDARDVLPDATPVTTTATLDAPAGTPAEASAAGDDPRRNPDPITGEAGSHPVGVGVGATAGGVTGAAIGSVVPGVGTVIGAAVGMTVGALAGGLAGKAVADVLVPTADDDAHDAHWREAHRQRPYYDPGQNYDYDTDYSAAYRFGYVSARNHPDQSFEALEATLEREWQAGRGTSRLSWEAARNAAHDAFERAREQSRMQKSE